MSLIRQIIISGVLIAGGWIAWGFVENTYFDPDKAQSQSGRPPDGRAAVQGGGGAPRVAPSVAPSAAQGERASRRRASAVVTAAVEQDASGIEVRAIGTSEAARAVTLFSEVSGVVAKVAIISGAMVDEGDVLLRLVDADQRIALERARLALASTRSALKRAERLVQTKSISSVTLSNAQTDVDSAGIDLRSAEIDLAKLSLTAPFAGTIGMTDLVVGDLVNSSRAVATLDDMSRVTVAFNVPERASGLVEVGKRFVATAEALPGERFEGEIIVVDSRVDEVSRSLKVKAELFNPSRILKPGMAITVVLNFEGTPRPQVPSLAIQWDRDGPYVWKVSEAMVHRVDVEIVGRHSGWVAVLAALNPGDQVVVEGLQRLREGATVRVLGAPPPDGEAVAEPGSRDQRPAGAGANAADRPGEGAQESRPSRAEGRRPASGG